jgi:hypothetical protein
VSDPLNYTCALSFEEWGIRMDSSGCRNSFRKVLVATESGIVLVVAGIVFSFAPAGSGLKIGGVKNRWRLVCASSTGKAL